jgi:hypothetical protein
MFIICPYTKFQMPCPNIPLVIATKLKAEYRLHVVAVSQFQVQQNVHTSINDSYIFF